MSELTFDGNARTITLRDKDGKAVGTWPANNRTASAASVQYIPNGTYT
jgi:hypothetical protein